MTADEFNAALREHCATGGTFVYFVGWLPDAKKRVGGDISELHLVAKLAMEAQAR
jgi:hypothetical protein